MTDTDKRMHNFAISLIFSILVWLIVDLLIMEISFIYFIFIEISIVIGQQFSNFIRVKLGLLTPQPTKEP